MTPNGISAWVVQRVRNLQVLTLKLIVRAAYFWEAFCKLLSTEDKIALITVHFTYFLKIIPSTNFMPKI
jgi:hypothetical protein